MFYLLLGLLLVGAPTVFAQQEARLMRFPHIQGNRVVFSYAGDIYVVNADGGMARRLTTHIGYELFPRISPDGKTIAFTAQYDGNSEVYVMPVEGGTPRRLTYSATLDRDDVADRMGPNNMVIGWTPDGKKIIYRTRSYTFNDFTGQLMRVSLKGEMPEEIPLENGGFCSFSPDGTELAYNYVFREFRTWKRYCGGMADDIRIWNLKSGESRRITDNVHQNIIPMWIGNSLYYISDKDNHMNLYRYDTQTRETRQITHFREYDIKFPAAGSEALVYENGGYLYKYDPATGNNTRLKIFIGNDQLYARPGLLDLSGRLRGQALSPGGERILATARGDIFSIPANEGVTYNLTGSCGANDMNAQWAPDGSGFTYISDKEDEFNLYWVDPNGQKERKLTHIKGYIFDFAWSPDSKKILWSAKDNTLNLLDVASGSNRVIEKSGIGSFYDFNWAPDSRHITYTRPQQEMNVVMVYDSKEGKSWQITDNWYDSGAPNFSDDGRYLLFVSNRTFNPVYGRTEWNHVYTNMSKIYLLPLAEDTPSLFAPKNDTIPVVKKDPLKEENSPKEANDAAGKKGSKKENTSTGKNGPKESKKTELVYHFDNLEMKMTELPIQAAYYGALHMVNGNIYFGGGGSTSMFDPKEQKTTDLGVRLLFAPGYKKVLALKEGKMQAMDLPKAAVNITKPVDTQGVRKEVDYRQEWMQIFRESWRRMRDFFYAPNMHGVDWEKMRKRYEVLVPYVNHRSDLTYLIGEMIGELNVGHAYSQNGEHPQVERVYTGMLGGRFSKDPKTGFFRVDRILEGANWSNELRSPLTMPGMNVKEGDYLLSVNGHSLAAVPNLFALLIGQADRMVELQVNSRPTLSGARTVLVKPIRNEAVLYYYDWVAKNTRKVSEATNGEVGYIHIPDMGVAGLNEFVKHYYPQLGKKALIIDDRGNGGGNVSPMITERLMRTVTYFSMHTNQQQGSPNPIGTFDGPKVLLVNEYSASDGDLFPYRFQYNKLGTVVGQRTWGGVVGYSGTIPFVDGGSIVTPSYAPFAADGSGWIIEGDGVHPDKEIENDPHQAFLGNDAQLEYAIKLITEQMQQYPYKSRTIPPFPNKAPKY